MKSSNMLEALYTSIEAVVQLRNHRKHFSHHNFSCRKGLSWQLCTLCYRAFCFRGVFLCCALCGDYTIMISAVNQGFAHRSVTQWSKLWRVGAIAPYSSPPPHPPFPGSAPALSYKRLLVFPLVDQVYIK